MFRSIICAIAVLGLCCSGGLLAQKGADPSQRYFRLICLLHLTGSGKGGDPIVPEYVAEGTAIAVASMQPQDSGKGNGSRVAAAATAAPAPMSSRPGIIGWGMQVSDDGKMAIVQMVAADHHAFDAILADKRGDIRVFEIGVTPAAEIDKELKKFKKDFELSSFRVMAQ